MVWAAWLYSQEWWRRELWKTSRRARHDARAVHADASARTSSPAPTRTTSSCRRARGRQHDVGTTPGFNGDVERALRSIKVPFLYMPSETDLYFPLTDARYEQQFIAKVQFTPIPSLWGHPAGAGASPADRDFLNTTIATFLAEK